MKRILIVAALSMAFLVVVTVVTGYLLPVSHVSTLRADVPAPREEVWKSVRTPRAFPEWRSDVTEVVVAAGGGDAKAWREIGSNGEIPMRVIEEDPPSRMVVRIDAEPSELPFGGRWVYVLATGGGGTQVTITEEGEVYNPVFRTMSRFVFGHTATIDAYLRALGRKHGADITPVVVEAR